MKIVTDYLIVLGVMICVLLFTRLLYLHIKERCKALIASWIANSGIKVEANDVTIHMFEYPLQATVIGIDGKGWKHEYVLQLGGTWRGSFLKQAKVLKAVALN